MLRIMSHLCPVLSPFFCSFVGWGFSVVSSVWRFEDISVDLVVLVLDLGMIFWKDPVFGKRIVLCSLTFVSPPP